MLGRPFRRLKRRTMQLTAQAPLLGRLSTSSMKLGHHLEGLGVEEYRSLPGHPLQGLSVKDNRSPPGHPKKVNQKPEKSTSQPECEKSTRMQKKCDRVALSGNLALSGSFQIHATDSATDDERHGLNHTADIINSIAAQVGSGDTYDGSTTPNDHYCWMRPEDIDYTRPVKECSSCFDLTAEMAAALAAASIVFVFAEAGSRRHHAVWLFEEAEREVKEGEEKDGKGKIVHHDSVDEQLKLGTPVRFKNKLWVVKELKENEVIEIEAPYSRRFKKVIEYLLKDTILPDTY
ncbi:hypothetical protein LR48_Vigan09g055700 [Vigna angularis]|uniref:cellulase n=1 Tax=Phaseolus angularis TaxID=3914 RepID=A0A0L9VA58_PHAAN|nr:hypothetical protein LR48_Vigan09g055700 [Vigna angularis]